MEITENQLHNIKQIYLPVLSDATSNVRIAHSAAMVKDDHLHRMTKFIATSCQRDHPQGVSEKHETVLDTP